MEPIGLGESTGDCGQMSTSSLMDHLLKHFFASVASGRSRGTHLQPFVLLLTRTRCVNSNTPTCRRRLLLVWRVGVFPSWTRQPDEPERAVKTGPYLQPERIAPGHWSAGVRPSWSPSPNNQTQCQGESTMARVRRRRPGDHRAVPRRSHRPAHRDGIRPHLPRLPRSRDARRRRCDARRAEDLDAVVDLLDLDPSEAAALLEGSCHGRCG